MFVVENVLGHNHHRRCPSCLSSHIRPRTWTIEKLPKFRPVCVTSAKPKNIPTLTGAAMLCILGYRIACLLSIDCLGFGRFQPDNYCDGLIKFLSCYFGSFLCLFYFMVYYTVAFVETKRRAFSVCRLVCRLVDARSLVINLTKYLTTIRHICTIPSYTYRNLLLLLIHFKS